jgi:hypothetical protein
MTRLTFPVEAWMGQAAVGRSGVWGAVPRRAEPSGSSRTAIDQPAERVVQAVANAPAGGMSEEERWAEHERRKAEHAALWQVWSEGEARREGQHRALAAAGAALGVRLRPLVIVWALVWPHRLGPSRATGGRWRQPSVPPSRGLREGLERACQGVGWVVWREDICWHRAPLLRGGAPTRWAGLAGPRAAARAGVQ